MDFKEALELANNQENLIGKKYNGATLDEIIIYPTNPQSFQSFERKYIKSMNAQIAIAPYVNEDVRVGCVFDKSKIFSNGVFIYTDIDNLSDLE